jgi:hypothetical protein
MIKTMKKLHVTLNGTTPLIMHSPKCVNPLHPIAKQMKALTSKKKKSEADLEMISDLEWEAGVYWDDSIGLVIPNECLAATFLEGAKMNKNGSAFQKYVQVVDSLAALDIGETQNYQKMKVDPRFRDVRSVCVMRARVIRTRPRFNTWRCEFDIMYDENKIDTDVIALAVENAGNYVGLCEMRKLGYGRFAAKIEERNIL